MLKIVAFSLSLKQKQEQLSLNFCFNSFSYGRNIHILLANSNDVVKFNPINLNFFPQILNCNKILTKMKSLIK